MVNKYAIRDTAFGIYIATHLTYRDKEKYSVKMANGYDSNSFIGEFMKVMSPMIDTVIASCNTEMSYKTLEHDTIYIVNRIQIHNNHCLLWLLDLKDFKFQFIKIFPKAFLDCVIAKGMHINNPFIIKLVEEEQNINDPILYIRFRPITMHNNYIYHWTPIKDL